MSLSLSLRCGQMVEGYQLQWVRESERHQSTHNTHPLPTLPHLTSSHSPPSPHHSLPGEKKVVVKIIAILVSISQGLTPN